MSFSPQFSLPKVIGHRGACRYVPENTVSSLKKASELGITWVEFDVVLTRDDVAIVLHDETLDRTTNGKGLVADTFYADIAKLDAGAWFSPQFVGEKVPTFVEYLDAAAKLGLGINVEIKPTPGNEIKTAEKVLAILHEYWPANAISPLVSSFSLDALRTVRALDQQLSLALLPDEDLVNWQDICQELNCISVNVPHAKLTVEVVQHIKSYAHYVLAYTVNDAARASALFAMGVDGVFSDCPDVIK